MFEQALDLIAEYSYEENIPDKEIKKYVRAFRTLDFSKLGQGELFVIFDALGLCGTRDESSEALWQFISHIWIMKAKDHVNTDNWTNDAHQ